MRKTGCGRARALQPVAPRRERGGTARAGVLTPLTPHSLHQAPANGSVASPGLPGMPGAPARRAAVRVLPMRQPSQAHQVGQSGTIAVLEPLELTPQPVMDGSLALLEASPVELDPTPRAAPARHHILIVEDDPRTAGVLRNALELEGEPDWGIEIASEGLCALESALRTPPDVVLLDVRLPGLDGGEVYRRLRTSQACGHTKVLFLSAGTALDLHLRGIDNGVLLRKPFEVPTLLRLVRALLAR